MSILPAIPLLEASHRLSDIQLVELGLATFAIGIVGGMVGIALGVVRLPVMTLLGVNPLIAAGDNLAVSFLGSIGGSFPHFFGGRIVWRVVILIGIPSVIGAFIGGRFAHIVPGGAVMFIVSALVLWSGVLIVLRSVAELKETRLTGKRPSEGAHGKLTRGIMLREGFLGVLVGVIGGAVGLALGVLRMPALVAVLKMDPLYAAGTNLAMTVLIGAAGFSGHLLGGRNDWRLLASTGTASIISMYIGARLSDKLAPGKLRLLIGVILVIIAPVLLWDAIRRMA
ncbi:MAG: sulfite exporter TauE/SafE family protein [Dehalococcoidia bacterium]|nr:sulfite exporter TauE/SafE family protein [Dehalococcoidia bacterium]